jgi:hypothetical protein
VELPPEIPAVKRPKVFPFLFVQSPRDSQRPTRLVLIKDATPLLLLAAMASRLGYELGSLHFDFPPGRRDADPAPLPVGLSAGPGDLLASAGRICTHPEPERYEPKPLPPPYTELGQHLAAAWRPFFREITRSHCWLAPELAAALPGGYEDRRSIWFSQREGSRFRELCGRSYQGEPRTAVFALRVAELWPGGPGYLGAFGLDGTISLVWAYLLSARHEELIREPGFAMVELSGCQIPKRPTDLEFALDWKAEVVLHVRH